MNIDYGRQLDLDQLMHARKQARTQGEREHYEQIMAQILNESEDVRYWRDKLLQAFRIGDSKGAERIMLRLQEIRLEETRGKSWGSQRGNKHG